jgi:hypothetical protein
VPIVVVACLLSTAACARHEECGPEDDCPLSVEHAGEVYLVSCDPVPRRLVGTGVDVTYDEERRYGPAYGVDGAAIRGFDAGEALAVRFAHEECSEPGWHLAHARDLPLDVLKAVFRRLHRARG